MILDMNNTGGAVGEFFIFPDFPYTEIPVPPQDIKETIIIGCATQSQTYGATGTLDKEED